MAETSTLAARRPSSLAEMGRRFETHLFEHVPATPLAFFRIAFGAIMLWEVTRYLTYDWVERYYIDPDFFFTYPGFGWIQPWDGNLMYVHFLGLGILATFILLGLFYRVSATLFFLGFTYVFLLDQSNYLNHFYLISIISGLMIFVPAHRAVSLDVVRRPDLAVTTAPAWSLWLLRFAIAVPYFFGGIAKINGDWLRGAPMRDWILDAADTPIIGPFVTEPWAAYFFSYGGLLFDLLVVPALLWKRTRPFAFLAALSFHLMNATIFSIGIFPWFMIAATLLFFEPENFEPLRRLQRYLGKPAGGRPKPLAPSPRERRLTPVLMGAFIAFMVISPFRHWLYPGNVSWTEEGHNFSWHMKLRDKSGRAEFTITDPATGETWTEDPRDHLSSRQRRKMSTRPDMILLFAHYLKEYAREEHGVRNAEVRVESLVSLNGREYQHMIDPEVDLTRVRRSIFAADWIVPLEVPLEIARED